jgi:hypothetical protein
MKKLLGIVVLGLLLSGNAYAKKYESTYKNYFDMTINGSAYSKKSFKESNAEALLKCQKNSKKKNIKPEGCLKHNIHRHSAIGQSV